MTKFSLLATKLVYQCGKFNSTLNWNLTEDSLVFYCTFDRCRTDKSGGGVFASGSFLFSVCSCRFHDCTAEADGGGLCAQTSTSCIARSLFSSCTNLAMGSGTHQDCHDENIVRLVSYASCRNTGTGSYSYGAITQRNGVSTADRMNGSRLYSRNRESTYHHVDGGLSRVTFSIFSSCSGVYTNSFHCERAPTQVQENVCTANSTVFKSISVLFFGNHIARNFVVCEDSPLITRGSDFDGTITFENCFFGCARQTELWIAVSNCMFSCCQQMLGEYFEDQLRCHQKGTFLFTSSTRALAKLVFVWQTGVCLVE